MLKKIAIVVAVLLVLLLGVIVTRPAEYTVSRSKTMAAPPTAVAPDSRSGGGVEEFRPPRPGATLLRPISRSTDVL